MVKGLTRYILASLNLGNEELIWLDRLSTTLLYVGDNKTPSTMAQNRTYIASMVQEPACRQAGLRYVQHIALCRCPASSSALIQRSIRTIRALHMGLS